MRLDYKFAALHLLALIFGSLAIAEQPALILPSTLESPKEVVVVLDEAQDLLLLLPTPEEEERRILCETFQLANGVAARDGTPKELGVISPAESGYAVLRLKIAAADSPHELLLKFWGIDGEAEPVALGAARVHHRADALSSARSAEPALRVSIPANVAEGTTKGFEQAGFKVQGQEAKSAGAELIIGLTLLQAEPSVPPRPQPRQAIWIVSNELVPMVKKFEGGGAILKAPTPRLERLADRQLLAALLKAAELLPTTP